MDIKTVYNEEAVLHNVLLVLSQWGDIRTYPPIHQQLEAVANESRRKQLERVLLHADTYLIAMMVIHRHRAGKPPFTLGELARTVLSPASPKGVRSKSQEEKIKTLLERLGEGGGLGLFHHEVVQEEKQVRYEIYATQRLLEFYSEVLHPTLSTLLHPDVITNLAGIDC